MKKMVIRTACIIVCAVMCFLTLDSGLSFMVLSDEASLKQEIAELQKKAEELQKEINALKKDASNKKALLNAVQKKVANTQAQISACNRQINGINAKISENNKEIEKRNSEIEANKLAFKKRIRAIYMSNSDSSVKILLGAESFADYLQLAQLTSAISSHDRAIIEDIVDAIDVLNKKNAENEKLLGEQLEVKNAVTKQYKSLAAEESEAQRLYNEVYADQKDVEQLKAETDRQIKLKQEALKEFGDYLDNAGTFINTNTGMMWPVPFTRNITSGWGERWGTFHYGIDIAAKNIYLKPVVAIADGIIYKSDNSCKHKSVKPSCYCGSGFGNHVRINHGTMTINGKQQKIGAIYGHMDYIIVSTGQHVKQGQILGYVGTTGSSTGYHLHLSLLVGGTNTHSNAVDPYPYFFK